MRIGRFAPSALAGIIAASMLGGCATLEQRTLIPIPQNATHLTWHAAPFAHVSPAGIRYSGIDQNEDYLLYRARGMQSEMVFINAQPAMSATFSLIEYDGKDLRHLARTWAINRNAGLQWGRSRRLRTPLATFTVQRYRLARTHRRCAAFQARWDIPANPQNWAAKVVFGYVCAAPRRPLPTHRVNALLTGLSLHYPGSGSAGHLPLLRPTPVPPERGHPAHGNAHFPFLFGIYHPTGGGEAVPGSASF